MQPHLTHSTRARSEDLRELLSRDHERLERLFRDLLAAFEADARQDVARLWNEFDGDLRLHLRLEEELLLPRFAETNQAEAAALQREHHSIRDKLLQLGVGVDLHVTRHAQVEDFVRELRAHARREDDLMYRWAEAQLDDPGLRRGLMGWLSAKLQPGASARG